ncbi:Spy/CpxP family protein refolding chaperone [Candidatus Nitrospira bockiana]
MQTRMLTMTGLVLGAFLAASFGVGPVWADPDREYGHGKGSEKDGYERHGRGHGMGMMMHGSTSHLLRHLLKHEKDIGLREDQVAKLKELQLNLDKTRIKTEADIMVLQREVKALVEDEKSDLAAIESKLKQSEELEVSLRMAAIKTRREAMGVLTPEQREKEKAVHEKMMQEHKMMDGHGGKGEHKKDESKEKTH